MADVMAGDKHWSAVSVVAGILLLFLDTSGSWFGLLLPPAVAALAGLKETDTVLAIRYLTAAYVFGVLAFAFRRQLMPAAACIVCAAMATVLLDILRPFDGLLTELTAEDNFLASPALPGTPSANANAHAPSAPWRLEQQSGGTHWVNTLTVGLFVLYVLWVAQLSHRGAKRIFTGGLGAALCVLGLDGSASTTQSAGLLVQVAGMLPDVQLLAPLRMHLMRWQDSTDTLPVVGGAMSPSSSPSSTISTTQSTTSTATPSASSSYSVERDEFKMRFRMLFALAIMVALILFAVTFKCCFWRSSMRRPVSRKRDRRASRYITEGAPELWVA